MTRLRTNTSRSARWRSGKRLGVAAGLLGLIALMVPSAVAVAGTNPSSPIAGNTAMSGFGNNSLGQLWSALPNPNPLPVPPSHFSATVVLHLYNGTNHTIPNPCTAVTMAKATMVSAGGDSGMALIAGGIVCVWGDNYWGEEAQGARGVTAGVGMNPTGTDGPVPACLPESWTLVTGPNTGYGYCSDSGLVLKGATSISAGGAFSLVLFGQGISAPADVTVTPHIAASMLPVGGVAAWGVNYNGELGSNWSASSPTAPYTCSGGNADCVWAPVGVASGLCGTSTASRYLAHVTRVSAGYNFALAQLRGASGTTFGTVCSWGDNTDGQLGLDGTSNVNPGGDSPNFCPYVGSSGSSYCSWTPQPVQSSCDGQQTSAGTPGTLSDVYDVSAGLGISLALLGDGHVCAWGDNTHGEVGINTNTGPNTCTNDNPQTFGPPTYTSCALSAQEVFTGTCPSGSTTNLSGARQISAGEYDAYALIGSTPWAGGTVCTWGDGSGGGLGNGAVADTWVPGAAWGVNGFGYIGNATCISAGNQHGLAVLMPSTATAGTLVTWGNDAGVGQNNGASTLWPVNVLKPIAPPTPVRGVSSISAGLGEWNLGTTGTMGCMLPPPPP